MKERRKHQRYPVIHEMDRPIQLSFDGKSIPGVLVDLSAGGMALLTYNNISLGKETNICIDLPGLKTDDLVGHVVWAIAKGEMWRLGIAFSKISPLDFRHINKIAFDFVDCETKINLGVNDVCTEKCAYFALCQKPVRIKPKE